MGGRLPRFTARARFESRAGRGRVYLHPASGAEVADTSHRLGAEVLQIAGCRPPWAPVRRRRAGDVRDPQHLGFLRRDRPGEELGGRGERRGDDVLAGVRAIEDHDEEGISSDPRVGENDTFYLQALAVTPSAQNAVELENYLLDAVRERAIAAGFAYLSTLIEAKGKDSGPVWLQDANVLEPIENYLGSGTKFLYLQAALAPRS